jgi:hypothetical protein
MQPIDCVPSSEDYKRIAGSRDYKFCWATAPYLYFFLLYSGWVLALLPAWVWILLFCAARWVWQICVPWCLGLFETGLVGFRIYGGGGTAFDYFA